MRSTTAGLVSLLLAGCGSRPALEAPARDADAQTRIAAYTQYRAYRQHYQITVERPFDDENTLPRPPKLDLVLANGTLIEHPTQLLPLVEPNSATAKAADAYAHLETEMQMFDGLRFGAMAAGVTVGAGWLLIKANQDDVPVDTVNPTVTVLALLVGSGMSMLFHALGNISREEALAVSVRAFSNYDADLRARLDLCEVAGKVAPCQSVEQAPPKPASGPALFRF